MRGGSIRAQARTQSSIAVSADGEHWTAFPCTASKYPYGQCAGWHPVFATADTGVDVTDPSKAGGDAFDLADIGVARARFVRVRDMGARRPACCGMAGFDLDAMAAIHFQ